ncbi:MULTISPECIES: GNAT family N-acetyltransferase [unclassified Streptomyces]|uniref:GNAT family N-acetyltransferase n=1 Tax=unclassified Streptomyces TaxID=2593676 RepID=UPI0022B627AC|nr:MULTISPECIES: GNAT family N-acetyltransferase [unclassified Streptomyces]MCZ7414569.1 GNAT family N-acetyltransferase [Streptomyces sp. WMMC897]MCZ7431496.1 GNAT family N-acetyltransferase [Streptomyces sp. WMMC1477]
MQPVTLTTARLLLRPFAPHDVEPVHAACQDPEIPRWTQVPQPYERRHAEDFLLNICPAGWRDGTVYTFGVFTHTGALVGSMGLVRAARLHTEDRTAELGYWTAPEQRGQGYTVEAARAVVDWAFTALGAERLEWYAHVGNEASRAVALRVGFVMEGVHRARTVHRGERRDDWSASLLPADWGRTSPTPYTATPPPA